MIPFDLIFHLHCALSAHRFRCSQHSCANLHTPAFKKGEAVQIFTFAQFSVAQFRSCAAGSAASEIVQNTLEVLQMCKILWYRAVVVQLKLWCKCWMWHSATVQMLHSVGSLCSRLQCHRCLLGATLATLNIKWLANALRHCHTHMEESEEKDENDDNDGNAGINDEYDVSAL